MAAGGPKMADGFWNGVYLLVFGRFRQPLLNNFFDPKTPSMRKVDKREKTTQKENNVVYSGH